MEQQITVGETYCVKYPFVRENVELFGEDGPYETKTWRPGVEWEQEDEYSDAAACADAFGEMLLTVVSMHKPGRFPTRVFYTRQWKDPDGHVFGKGGLRISTLEKFRRISRGYRHEIWVDGEKQPNGEVRGASVTAQPACEASSREAATSTVVLAGTNGGKD